MTLKTQSTSKPEAKTTKTESKKKPRALVLMSGGLDSSLAAKMLKEQGVDVIGIYFYTGFCITAQKSRTGLIDQPKSDVTKVAEQIGIPLEMIDISRDYIPMVSKPKYGYGKNMNPCIDCRIFMLRKAKDLMEFFDADFIATGEVLGQRPKSQKPPTQRLIEKESGLEGILIRPLSYKHFPESIPEKKGWIQREKLGDITGRSRKKQMELAKKWGITEAATPAGGCCFLADETYSIRFKDLLQERKKLLGDKAPELTDRDVVVLGLGRQIKIRPGLKLIIGRFEGENNVMYFYRQNRVYLEFPKEIPGPSALIDSIATEQVPLPDSWKKAKTFLANNEDKLSNFEKIAQKIKVLTKTEMSGKELMLMAGIFLRYRKKNAPAELPITLSFTDFEGNTLIKEKLTAIAYDEADEIKNHILAKATFS
ncbi:MAG: hypothetical protein D6767_00290 [Candidatus Hydrogenedentota bacterium]|nr:MAG: hypothetical protein D6767_00290 [Candidatus Hydrogenedentota bacterium]